jgi:hypothetical protein
MLVREIATMLKKLLQVAGLANEEQRLAKLYRDFIRHEAKIGGQLFGPIQPGGRREFFCLDETTWIWHEEWTDKSGNRQTRTTRYDVRPEGIVKAQDGSQYQQVTEQEALRLYDAVQAYKRRIYNEIYQPIL